MTRPTTPPLPVLVVGAGPTGLALALELSRQGIRFRIVDRNATRSGLSKALITQSRTLELLNRHRGMARGLVRGGVPGVGIHVYARGRKTTEVDLTDLEYLDTEFPSPLWTSQADLEREMASMLGERDHGDGDGTAGGGVVERGVRVAEVAMDTGDGGFVEATLRKKKVLLDGADADDLSGDGGGGRAEEEERVRARYVVGCDGARSTVRASSGNITFDGSSYEQEFILCDTHVRWEKPPNKMHIMWGRNFMAAIPMRNGLVRLTGTRRREEQLSSGADGDGYDAAAAAAAGDATKHERAGGQIDHGDLNESGGGHSNKTPSLTLETFQQAVDEGLDETAELFDPVYMSAFRLHHRVASSYRDGRILLAGDAAHIHSPAGGQGMNTGIQDAVNLGWKLGSVIRREDLAVKHASGTSPPDLLDSYGRERRPVGLQILKTTDRMFSFMVSTGWFLTIIRNFFFTYLIPLILSNRARRTRAFTFISQMRVRYRNSSNIVGTGTNLMAVTRGMAPKRGGDRCCNGKVIISTGDRDATHGETLWLMDVCRDPCHHLVLFTGATKPGEGPAWAAALAENIKDVSKLEEVDVHWVGIQQGESQEARQDQPGATLLDSGGFLHDLYGFTDNRLGYVLVRPDQHIAHIGTWEDTGEFLDWAGWYFG
ncbi:uncharacterized protein MKZ38_001012 [Zalerion maritima]|uniref:FAD-binding domain-containing protein n=1 Tax=Zalerion maritima TaxID=339359 RepID=A0AAD5RQV2_9PEZI|nr:uncharacterized protein MKZ38_001012 [Zalerion maritima]